MALIGHVAVASIEIKSTPEDVWDALVNSGRIEKYMFGTQVASDWEVGSPITWKGEWEGNRYEDKGVILEFQPEKRLSYSHYSPLAGEPDLPENHHTVIIELTASDGGTTVTLTQDNNDTEEARDHSESNWRHMLAGLRQHVEAGN